MAGFFDELRELDRILDETNQRRPNMLKPRNTLVTVAPLDRGEKKVGSLIVPDETSKFYEQCEVIEIGPGMLTHKDETSPCADLKKGQRVLVHNYARTPDQRLQPIGVSFRTEDHRDLILVEQSQIVAIVAEPQDETPNLKLTDTEQPRTGPPGVGVD